MTSKESGRKGEKFLENHNVFSEGNILKGKYQLDVYLFSFLFSFFFLFVKLHSIYNCSCFDSIRFEKTDVLGV